MRSFIDIQKANSNTQFVAKATKYYDALANYASQANVVIDIFIASLDQSGLLEMKSLSEMTGGVLIM